MADEIARIRWEVVTCYVADIPRDRVPSGVLADREFAAGQYEQFLEGLRDHYLAREVGDDGGRIVEVEIVDAPPDSDDD